MAAPLYGPAQPGPQYPPSPVYAQQHHGAPPPPQYPQTHGQPPPPPQYGQAQGQHPPPPQYGHGPAQGHQQAVVVYHQQPTTTFNMGMNSGVRPGMHEICPYCHKQVVMDTSRCPTALAWLLGFLACLFFCAVLCVGPIVCVIILCIMVDITYTCPNCKKEVRVQRRGV